MGRWNMLADRYLEDLLTLAVDLARRVLDLMIWFIGDSR